MRSALLFALLATAVVAQETGGSTVRGAGTGTSAPPAQDVRIAPTVPAPVPQEIGGINANVAATTAIGTGRVVDVLPPPVSGVPSANTGGRLINGNANTRLTNASGGTVVTSAKIAPSGSRSEPAMTTSGSAGVVPSGPRVETLPQSGVPTTVAPTR